MHESDLGSLFVEKVKTQRVFAMDYPRWRIWSPQRGAMTK